MSETDKSIATTFEHFTARASIFSLVASALTSVLDYDALSHLFLNWGILFGLGRGASKLVSYTANQLSSALSPK